MRQVPINSSCLSVCPSVRMEQLGSHWTDFQEIWYFVIFLKCVYKIRVSLKSDNNIRYCTSIPPYITDRISLSSSYNNKSIRQKLYRRTKHTFYVWFWDYARFSAPVQTGPGGHPASYTMGTGSFTGVKRPGRGADHPPTSSSEVEGRVELYICSPSGPSWPVLGWSLPLPLHFVFNNFFFRKSCRLWDNVEKYCRAGQATDDSMQHAQCTLDT